MHTKYVVAATILLWHNQCDAGPWRYRHHSMCINACWGEMHGKLGGWRDREIGEAPWWKISDGGAQTVFTILLSLLLAAYLKRALLPAVDLPPRGKIMQLGSGSTPIQCKIMHLGSASTRNKMQNSATSLVGMHPALKSIHQRQCPNILTIGNILCETDRYDKIHGRRTKAVNHHSR